MDRLPMIGTDEWKAWCQRADKGIRGNNIEKRPKPKPVAKKARFGGVRRETVPRPIKERAMHLRLVDQLSNAEVISKIYAEFDKYHLSKSALKNFIWLHNKALRELKQ